MTAPQLEGATPRPWFEDVILGRRTGYVRASHDRRPIADFRYRNGLADAALVVKAVNAYDRVLDAVGVVEALPTPPVPTELCPPETVAALMSAIDTYRDAILDVLRAALDPQEADR